MHLVSRSLLIALVSISSNTALLLAQDEPSLGVERSERLPLPSAGYNWTRPLVILGLGAAASLSVVDDEDPFAMRSALDTSAIDFALDQGNTYGDGLLLASGSFALWATGSLSGRRKMQLVGTDLMLSFVASGALNGVFKYAFDRRRPDVGHLSFPSGHTATAWSTVPVLAHHFGWKVGIAAATMATCTGLGRIEEGRHDLSDVLFGASVGLAVGDLVSQRRAQRTSVLDHVTITTDRIGWTMRW